MLNVTMDVLADWAQRDAVLASGLASELERLQQDPRKSVAKRATRHRGGLPG